MFWNSKKSFVDVHVCITGGSEGLGLALAQQFVQESANVSIIARTASKLEIAVQALKECCKEFPTTSKIMWSSADVTKPESVQEAINTVREKFGPIDVLICCAGVSQPGRFLELDLDAFKAQMDVNYIGTVTTVKAVVPEMVERRLGEVVIIASALAVIGLAGYSAYSPSKWALRGFADSLRMELQAYDVGVSIAYPPDMTTPGYERELKLTPPEVLAMHNAVGDKAFAPERVAELILSGLKKGVYHLPTPDFLQTLSQSTMASLSPYPFFLPFQMCIAGLVVPVSTFITGWFDRIVKRHLLEAKTESSKKGQ
ncbi:hypothetical protein BSKO_13643 [Bryopsis sp. KO-2023]|nr:hypothetical protein BSKO_13643 [Bryopsis sp. KO-2023]